MQVTQIRLCGTYSFDSIIYKNYFLSLQSEGSYQTNEIVASAKGRKIKDFAERIKKEMQRKFRNWQPFYYQKNMAAHQASGCFLWTRSIRLQFLLMVA